MYISEITIDTHLPPIKEIITRYMFTLLIAIAALFPTYLTKDPVSMRSKSISQAIKDPYNSVFNLVKADYETKMLNKNGLTGLPPISPHIQHVILHEQSLRYEAQNLSYQIERISPDISPYLARKISYAIINNTKGLSWPTPIDVASIIKIESNFEPNIYSSAGAYGLMQIGDNWRGKLPYSAFNSINGNIKYGIYIMRVYYRMFHGNERAAILSYNCGEGAYMNGRYVNSYWDNFANARYQIKSI